MAVRAIRGAVQLQQDDLGEMTEAVTELLTTILQRNELSIDDLISILFTSTPDLVCGFPATAARGLGLGDVPLLCAQELDIEGSLPRVVRVMLHAEMDVDRAGVNHVYLRGAEALRRDIAQ
ncbi:MAG: chorismate mutase [Actinobacteria bacterium]|nr:chorismate mutase [Actinomycetota bacterium]